MPNPLQICSDGTLYNLCSSNKPKFCDNGNLVDNCVTCGCPSGRLCNSTTNLCYSPTSCTENWQCGKWSKCSNKQQTRVCTDLNNCGTTINKPYENKTCSKYRRITLSGQIKTTSGICSSCQISMNFLDSTNTATTDSTGSFSISLEPSYEFDPMSYIINGTIIKPDGRRYIFRRTISIV